MLFSIANKLNSSRCWTSTPSSTPCQRTKSSRALLKTHFAKRSFQQISARQQTSNTSRQLIHAPLITSFQGVFEHCTISIAFDVFVFLNNYQTRKWWLVQHLQEAPTKGSHLLGPFTLLRWDSRHRFVLRLDPFPPAFSVFLQAAELNFRVTAPKTPTIPPGKHARHQQVFHQTHGTDFSHPVKSPLSLPREEKSLEVLENDVHAAQNPHKSLSHTEIVPDWTSCSMTFASVKMLKTNLLHTLFGTGCRTNRLPDCCGGDVDVHRNKQSAHCRRFLGGKDTAQRVGQHACECLNFWCNTAGCNRHLYPEMTLAQTSKEHQRRPLAWAARFHSPTLSVLSVSSQLLASVVSKAQVEQQLHDKIRHPRVSVSAAPIHSLKIVLFPL